MKTRLLLVSISILLILIVTYTAFAQGKKKDNNGKKEQQHKTGKEKDKEDKGGKENKESKEKKNDNTHDKQDKTDHGNHNGHKVEAGTVYHWSYENFKDRDKIKKQEKVTICHNTGRNQPGVALNVSRHALQAHLNHGDAIGTCPKSSNANFSSAFIDRRNEYYTTLQNTQEQVLYSRSIYEYAVERLTNSRTQLVLMQNNNVPVAEIQTKQAVVTELEQNVSLLQTLIGVAVNLLLNKLQ